MLRTIGKSGEIKDSKCACIEEKGKLERAGIKSTGGDWESLYSRALHWLNVTVSHGLGCCWTSKKNLPPAQQ